MKTYYIGADVHCNTTEIAIEALRRIEARYCVPTTVAAIRQVLDSLQGVKRLALEESTLAGWLSRNLRPHVKQLIVCDPRRNRLIAADGDKDDGKPPAVQHHAPRVIHLQGAILEEQRG